MKKSTSAKTLPSMTRISFILILLLVSASAATAQLSGPSNVCPNVNNTFTGSSGHYRITWSITNGSFTGTTLNQTSVQAKFTANGTITVTYYMQNDPGLSPPYIFESSETKNVSIHTIGTLSASSPVCSSASLSLVGGTPPAYSWQVSPTGANSWTQFSTSTSGTASNTISQTSDFRVVSTSCSPTSLVSNVVTVSLKPQSVAGTIGGTATICSGSTSPQITNVVSSTPSDASIQWQQSVNGGSTWTNIVNSGSPGVGKYTYSPGVLTQTTSFRRVIVNSCSGYASATSNSITITVVPQPTTGTLSSVAAICLNPGSSQNVSVSASSLSAASASWEYRYSDNGGSSYSSWTQYSTSTSSPTNLSVSTIQNVNRLYQVRVTATNSPCTAVTSLFQNITIYSNDVGSVAPALVESYGPTSGTLTLSGLPSGATLQKWQKSTDNGVTWSDPTGSITNPTISYTANVNTKYKGLITNGSCSAATSPVSSVVIYPKPIITIQNNNPPALAIGNTLVLQVGSYADIKWYKDGNLISGATTNNYTVSEPGRYTVIVKGSATASAYESDPKQVYALGYQPDNTTNMVVTTLIRKPGVTSATNLYSLQPYEYAQNITYSDGLARPTQNIAIGLSPLELDIVTPYQYITSGIKTYSSYATTTKNGWYKSTALTDQSSFYLNTTTKAAYNADPYAQILIEHSPLARPTEIGDFGTDKQPQTGHSIRPQFQINSANTVRKWTAAGPSGFYDEKSLAVTKTLDRNSNLIYEFIDKSGRLILKRIQVDASTYLETYNVYDSRGNVIIQVPPKASDLLNSTAWSTTFRDQHCFVYTYDERNRLIEKRVPDAAPVYCVYDPLDRPVLMQDGNLRSLNKWVFLKYDYSGRSIMTGLYTNTTETTRSAMQDLANNLYSASNSNYPATTFFESRGTTLHGYTNLSFPKENTGGSPVEALTVNYFDDYDFDSNGTDDYSYTSQGLAGEGISGSCLGLVTGSKRLVLGSSNWIYNYNFYDKQGRTIQVRNNNHLSTTIDNLVTIVYDFEGKVKYLKKYHNAGGTNQTTVVNRVEYDDGGRAIAVYQKINTQTEQQLSGKSYNELSQLIEKNLHVNGSSYVQSVDYRYDISGALKSINNSTLDDNSEATQDFFGMNILYGTSNISLGNTGMWDGSVSAVLWKGPGASSGETDQQAYKFTYDKSERLTKAEYRKYSGTLWNKESGSFDESQSYDANGNIVSLSRNRITRNIEADFDITTSTEQIDNLGYVYSSTKSNQLSKVTDTGPTDGFNDGSNTTTEYTYTSDGSLSSDLNKGIQSITYNVLNKPSVITFSGSPTKSVTYTYDGGGSKLKVVTNDGANTVTTDYVDGFVYQNSTLSFFPTPEGRAVPESGTFKFQYNIHDYQGNVRVVFGADTPPPDTYTATFENNTITNEQSTFSNYPTGGQRSSLEKFDHTDFNGTTYTYSQLLNGGYNSQVGLAKSLKVYPGDVVTANVYAKYWNSTSTSSNINGFAAALTSAFGLSAGATGEALKAYNSLNTYGGVVAAADGSGNENSPKAFITILLFDQNYKLVEAAYDQIDAGAVQGAQVSDPKAAFDQLTSSLNVKEPGYAFIYISNENPTLVDVYFDDLTIQRTKTKVIQYNEYYPFGLQTSNSWTRENAVANQFLYNSGSELNSTTGVYDLAFRNYDAALGRFMQVDPLAVSASNYSPYAYANLNPVLFNDPLGLLTLAQFDDIIRDLMNSPYGGKWSQDGGYREYDSELDAFNAGVAYMDAYGMWGGDGGRFAHNFESAAKVFATSSGNPMPLREVTIKETRTNANWLQERIDEVLYKVHDQTQGNGPQVLYAGFGFDNTDDALYTINALLGFTGVGVAYQGEFWKTNELWHTQKNGTTRFAWDKLRNNNFVKQSRLNSLKSTSGLRSFSNGLAFASIALTAVNVAHNGEVRASDAVNVFMASISFTGVGSIIAGGYFLLDFGFDIVTGESLGERIDKAVGSPLVDW